MAKIGDRFGRALGRDDEVLSGIGTLPDATNLGSVAAPLRLPLACQRSWLRRHQAGDALCRERRPPIEPDSRFFELCDTWMQRQDINGRTVVHVTQDLMQIASGCVLVAHRLPRIRFPTGS